ncbi:hypothetical protein V6N13_112058 [Hibiscus sabdariffa]|uniref:Uncharacterized protein n=1 Tax=Hibiscus sabdariffa TaxID=183260 RepID=A0ABR2TM38_9ROSI
MGGCATKPKVLKGDDRSIPAPPPESTKEAVAAASEVKEGADVVAAEADVAGEDVKSKDADENEKKGVAETEAEIETDNKTPSEPTKIEPLEPVEQESLEKKVPTEPIESTKEPEPLTVEPEAAPEATATATVDVAETEKKEAPVAAAAEGEEGKTEVAK